MKGLIFEALTPQQQAAPNRTDIACFIGLVKVRDGELPEDLVAWLVEEGWWATPESESARGGAATLVDVPLPIDSWERFDQLFAWDEREYEGDVMGATYLGAAVRSFFAQGGRKCYVICCGEPLAFDAERATRDEALFDIVPANLSGRVHRGDWHGLHHLLGLPEVSFITFPDLPELACDGPADEFEALAGDALPAVFSDCALSSAVEETEKLVVQLPASRADDNAFFRWRAVVHRAALWLSDHRRDVQMLAALPLPALESSATHEGVLAFMHRRGWLSSTMGAHNCPTDLQLTDQEVTDFLSQTDQNKSACSSATAFLQLAYPWLRFGYAGDLPDNIEPSDGVLAGLLARNALTRGTFRSATALDIQDLIDLVPRLHQSQTFGLNPAAPDIASAQAPLIDRISLFGRTPEGIRLLSDVTTSNDLNYRQAGINRTINLVMRAARSIGEEYVYESSGERLWGQLQARLSDVLSAMHGVGALAGRRSTDAFQVRCDRSTMSQQDIDAGRVIVQVLIRPAASIETMRIQLALSDSGRVSLASIGMEAA